MYVSISLCVQVVITLMTFVNIMHTFLFETFLSMAHIKECDIAL